jgi:glycosyltransferase involved in cell wall biosynthesis
MKIFAISVVKNEVDIIKRNLEEASKWADKIFVYDNGSTDGTWETVQALKSDRIIPWKSDNKPFYDGIRGEVFNEFRYLATEGDWWCFRLDADEFYEDNPVDFLSKVSSWYHFIATNTIHFWITKEDIAEGILLENAVDNIDKIRYYEKKTWTEARFFRHRKSMIWNSGDELPARMGVLCPKRIRVKHYQYRSLKQIAVRIAVRKAAIANGFTGWQHASKQNVDDYLFERKDLNFYEGNGQWKLEGSHNKYFQRLYDVILKSILFKMSIYK